MRRIKSSWAPALLLVGAVFAEAVMDLHRVNAESRVKGERIENLISGVDRSQKDSVGIFNVPAVEQVNTVDINELLRGTTQGQGTEEAQTRSQRTEKTGAGDINSNDVGSDRANQIAKEDSPSINQIPGGFNGQQHRSSKNQSATQEQGQTAQEQNSPQESNNPLSPSRLPKGQNNGFAEIALTGGQIESQGTGRNQSQTTGATSGDIKSSDIAGDIANQLANHGQGQQKGQGQASAQKGGGNAQIIQIKQTIFTEANGQQVQTVVIQVEGKQPQAAAPPATTSQAQATPPVEAQPTPTPSPTPAPEAQMPAEFRNSTAAAEAQMPKPEVPPSTMVSMEGLNATMSSTETSKSEAASTASKESSSASTSREKAAAVTVSAGKKAPAGMEAAARANSSAPAIDSGTLKPGGLAATTTSAVGNPITVQAGGSGSGNSSSVSMGSSREGSASSTTAVIAGLAEPSGSRRSASIGTSTAATVTVQAGSGGSNSSVAQAQVTSTKCTVTVLAGSGTSSKVAAASSSSSSSPSTSIFSSTSSSTTSVHSATPTQDALLAASTTFKAGAAVTVIAGPGGRLPNATAAEQAASNGGCNCLCSCPAGSFPMDAPLAPAFQLGPMGPAPASTLQTVASAITAIAGGEVPPAAQSPPSTSPAIPPSVDSATLTLDNSLIAASSSSSSTSPPPPPPSPTPTQSVAVSADNASASAPISPEAPPAVATSSSASSSSSPSSSATTSVGAQSQIVDAPPPPTPVLPIPDAASGLPFDINTIDLQSRVTVNLGRRGVRPRATAGARKRSPRS